MSSAFQTVLHTRPTQAVGDRTLRWLALAAIVFGLVKVASSGRALFGSPASRAAVGHAVPFVRGFHYLSGFIYLVAVAGRLRRRRWTVYAALFVAVSKVLVFLTFGLHAIGGGAHELRTVGATTLRSSFWVAATVVTFRALQSLVRPSQFHPPRTPATAGCAGQDHFSIPATKCAFRG
jgi:cell division protein FtsW (lipid II flippase)